MCSSGRGRSLGAILPQGDRQRLPLQLQCETLSNFGNQSKKLSSPLGGQTAPRQKPAEAAAAAEIQFSSSSAGASENRHRQSVTVVESGFLCCPDERGRRRTVPVTVTLSGQNVVCARENAPLYISNPNPFVQVKIGRKENFSSRTIALIDSLEIGLAGSVPSWE